MDLRDRRRWDVGRGFRHRVFVVLDDDRLLPLLGNVSVREQGTKREDEGIQGAAPPVPAAAAWYHAWGGLPRPTSEAENQVSMGHVTKKSLPPYHPPSCDTHSNAIGTKAMGKMCYVSGRDVDVGRGIG